MRLGTVFLGKSERKWSVEAGAGASLRGWVKRVGEQLGSVEEEAKYGQGALGTGWTRTGGRQERQTWEEVAVCG